jgi:hypothetical protein
VQIQETMSFLRWLCEHEYRIQYSDAAVEVWHYSLRAVDASVAQQAVLEHYRANEAVVATPGGIAKRAGYIASAREAGNRAAAIEPAPTPQQQNAQDGKLIRSWRDRNREEWDRLVAKGAADRKADLEARGLPSHFPGRAA